MDKVPERVARHIFAKLWKVEQMDRRCPGNVLLTSQERRSALMRRRAHHEAGHAFIAVGLGQDVARASLKIGAGFGGYVRLRRPPRLQQRGCDRPARARFYVIRQILIVWAGPLAESIYRRRTAVDGATGATDIWQIKLMLTSYWKTAWHPDLDEVMEQLQRLCEEILLCCWPRVEAVAAALLEHGSLTGAQLRRLACVCKGGAAVHGLATGQPQSAKARAERVQNLGVSGGRRRGRRAVAVRGA